MKAVLLSAASLAAAGPVRAEDIVFKPLVDARLRYEHVDQDQIADRADALVLRVRSGLTAGTGRFTALMEAQGNLALVGRYNDGLGQAPARPLVADPENVALYRAQLQYRTRTFGLTAGRQRIALDDERFVGAIAFRQNGQTFDAVRVEWSGMPKLKADLTYAWSVRTIWGIDGAGARQQAVSGNNILANLSYATPLGALTGFAYLVDQDEAAVQGYRLSSQTYGVRLAGVHAFTPSAGLSYQASFARQSDYRGNPNDYRAKYYLVDATLDLAPVRLGAGYEVLGAARGAALTSFQTPLATGFKFQGWADKFLTTPPDGIRDLYASLGYGVKRIGPATAVQVQAVYHRFNSDRRFRRYGNELDLIAGARIGRYLLSARYADYAARGFATDTRKAWLQIDFAL